MVNTSVADHQAELIGTTFSLLTGKPHALGAKEAEAHAKGAEAHALGSIQAEAWALEAIEKGA